MLLPAHRPAENTPMNVTLTPELERFVTEKVKSGQYPDASRVICDGLTLLRLEEEQQGKHEELKREIQKGIDSLERGEGVPLDDAEVARIKAEGRKRRAADGAKGHEHAGA
jgi:antitoxin ParD1/3/4